MDFKNIAIMELLPDPKNPRKDLKPEDPEFQRINTSIEKFGFLEPIVFNTRTKKILGGHQRLKTLKNKGIEELHTIALGAYSWAFTDDDLKELSPSEENAANIALNKAQGDWDVGQLVINLQELKLDDMLEFTGFDDKEFDGLLREIQGIEKGWNPEKTSEDNIVEACGYGLGSIWYDLPRETEYSKYFLELPDRNSDQVCVIGHTFSRTNATETERIIKTYMREGDTFFEMCCGWTTFSSIAKHFGFSGKAGDIWGVSIDFCKKQIPKMPGKGSVEIIYADCRDTKEKSDSYNFVHSNPPFFSLEKYSNTDKDLANQGSYELWLDAMADMGKEAERILKPGGIANFVINDFREENILVPMHADFIKAILSKSNLVLWDFAIAEVKSQAIRFRKKLGYDYRRTIKCHEYVITFRKKGFKLPKEIKKEGD